MTKIISALLIILIVTILIPDISLAEPDYVKCVKQHLKDPDSAKFKNYVHSRSNDGYDEYFCGEYNSKNSYGGYEGYSRFIVQKGFGVTQATLEGTTIVAADVHLQGMKFEVEIINDRKLRKKRGGKLEVLSVETREKLARQMAFEKEWTDHCTK